MVDALQSGQGGALAGLMRVARVGVLQFAADRLPPTATGWTHGARIEARVIGTLPDGRTQLEIDGVRVDARLPPGADDTPGARLALTVLRHGATLDLLARTPAPASTADPGAEPSATVRLSALGDALSAVLTARADPDTPPDVDGTGWLRPLLAAATTDPVRLAGALRDGLQSSGLFYEAHQAEWVDGQRDLAQLRAEPQGRLPVARDTGEAVAAASRAEAQARAAAPDGALRIGRADAAAGVGDASPAPPSPLAAIVDRQLEAVGTRHVTWAGQVWPGQALEWRIEERVDADAHADDAVPAGAAAWVSSLRLTLPRLGRVDARLELRGATLRIGVDADAAAAAALADRLAPLQAALEARGLAVAALAVRPRDGR
ncbi:MAG: flagellar hook-length control protein FliK [Burkholderiales bacterium]|jgi:hypothetical protein|nr:flagellar hook-length control protein FliK [Burkholderiales bacterium]